MVQRRISVSLCNILDMRVLGQGLPSRARLCNSRPETELVVEEALRHFVKGSFLDWGTGSGCIAATILAERPLSRGVAIEVSPQAIEWAWKNLRRYNLLHRCLLWHSREMSDIPVPSQSLDLIISNPPYIPTAAIGRLMKEVAGYEPYVALDGGEDGLLYYKELLHVAPIWLKPGGMLVVELGDSSQGEVLANYKALGLRLIFSRYISHRSLVSCIMAQMIFSITYILFCIR